MHTSSTPWFLSKSALVGLFAFVTSSLPAQIIFSMTGIAQATGLGFEQGESYSFTLTTGERISTYAPVSTFHGSLNSWVEESNSHDPIFVSLTGDGLTGSLLRPSGGAPYSFIDVSPGSLAFSLSKEDPGFAFGVLTPDGGLLDAISGSLSLFAVEFDFPGTGGDAVTYFGSYVGEYVPDGGMIRVTGAGGTFVEFTPTSLAISAVPEPSTYAALAASGVLVFAVWRRRGPHGRSSVAPAGLPQA